MSDLDHQNFNPTQSDKQPNPVTIASAATIAPTTRMSRITGTTPVTRIVPPVSGYHELVFVWTTGTVGAFATGGAEPGAIHAAYTTISDRPVVLYYDPNTKLYYVGTVA